ncbi:MAG: hypothetical protein J7M29_05325 [Verrucomicrobia bacterium]|nr:hypothetical protein [Verrucomicrobiota bacterium]
MSPLKVKAKPRPDWSYYGTCFFTWFLFAAGCLFLWANLTVMASLEGTIVFPPYSQLCGELRNVMIWLPVVMFVYMIYLMITGPDFGKTRWIGFFAFCSGTLILLTLVVFSAISLVLITAAQRLLAAPH